MRKLILRTTLLVMSTLLTLLLVEIASRLFVPQTRPLRGDRNFWVYDDLLGWKHRPLEQGTFSHRHFSVSVSINSQGLRDDEYSLERVAEKKRLAILGASNTWGFGVERHETFADILEFKHAGWEIINAAVSGYGTDQMYLYYKHYGIQYNPDVVLLVIHQNDLIDNIRGERNRHNKPVFRLEDDQLILTNTPVPKTTLKQNVARFVYGHTYFLSSMYHALKAQKKRSLSTPAIAGAGDHAPVAYEITGRLLLAANDVVTNNGAQFIVVSDPTAKGQFVDFLSKTLGDAGIPYLPLYDAFTDTGDKPLFIENDVHWNALGHGRVAAAVDAFLTAQGIFENESTETD